MFFHWIYNPIFIFYHLKSNRDLYPSFWPHFWPQFWPHFFTNFLFLRILNSIFSYILNKKNTIFGVFGGLPGIRYERCSLGSISEWPNLNDIFHKVLLNSFDRDHVPGSCWRLSAKQRIENSLLNPGQQKIRPLPEFWWLTRDSNPGPLD